MGSLGRRRSVLVLTFFASLTVASTPICVPSLKFLAAAESGVAGDPRGLITETYLELWRTLAIAKLDAKQAAALLDEPDPWAIPKTGGDFTSLERRMAEFGELLDKKGWRSPEVTQDLRRAKRELLAGLIDADRRTQEAIRHAGDNSARDVVLPGAETGVVTPDGSFVYTVVRDGSRNRLLAHDMSCNQTVALDLEATGLKGPYLVPDGSGLYLLKEGAPSLTFFPLKNGFPVKDGAVILAKAPTLLERWWPASFVPVDAAMGRSIHLVVGRYENPAGYYLFDRLAKKLIPLKVPLNAGETVLKWGFVPGTDELYFLAGSRGVGRTSGFQKFVLLREPLPNPYVPKAPGKNWEWQTGTDSEPDSVHFAWRDGGADAVFGFNVTGSGTARSTGVLQTMNFPPPSGTRNLPTLVTSTVEVAAKIRSVTAPAAGKQVMLAMQSDQPGLNQIVSIDPMKPETLKRGPRVPHHEGFRLSLSPEKIFVFGKSGAVQWVWDDPARR